MKLIEVVPGRWRMERPQLRFARSDLPMPNVISDIMPPTEQVDGNFYTSKRAFRAVGRANGLTEVGNEKLKPKGRESATKEAKSKRQQSIKKAIDRYKSGERVKQRA